MHIEIASTDPTRTRKFLEEVFEWKFQDMPEMQYATYEPASGPGGGLMSPMENQPPGFLNYLMSSDIDRDLRKVETAGGQVLRPKSEIPNVGWWAMFQEPTGIVMALFQGLAAPPRERRARTRRRPAARKARGGRRGTRGRARGRRGR